MHATLPKPTARIAPRRYAAASLPHPRAEARPVRAESIAAPLALAAVVIGTLAIAIAIALVGALGA